MKRLLAAAVSLAALGFASAALAEGEPPATIEINATNPAQCNVSATQTSVTLPTNSVSDTDGFINSGLAEAVALALNGAGVHAWCTGNHNGVVLSRTALTTGGGAVNNGFAEGAIYDVQITIADATRSDAHSSLEGTSDGAGNGPGQGGGAALWVSSFGPTGAGSPVVFAAETGSVESAVTNGTAGGQGDTDDFDDTSARLVAGEYQGTITLTLFPGT